MSRLFRRWTRSWPTAAARSATRAVAADADGRIDNGLAPIPPSSSILQAQPAAQGRGAERGAVNRRRARHRRLRQTDRQGRGARLSPARLGRRPLSQLCAGLCGGLLHRLPGKRRNRGHGHVRNRPDLSFRAAARLRGAADAGADPHGGRRRAQALALSSIHRRRARDGAKRSPTASRCRWSARLLYALGDFWSMPR